MSKLIFRSMFMAKTECLAHIKGWQIFFCIGTSTHTSQNIQCIDDRGFLSKRFSIFSFVSTRETSELLWWYFFVATLSTLLVNHNQPPYNHFQSLTYYLCNLKCDCSAQQKRQGLFHEEDEEAQGHPVSY